MSRSLLGALLEVDTFHEQFNIPVVNVPELPAHERYALRYKLHEEEYDELQKAMFRQDLPDIADSIADLIYVLLGTALEYGIPIEEVWKAVHEANMAKKGGEKRNDGKILKPEGWVPPDIEGILKKAGWQP